MITDIPVPRSLATELENIGSDYTYETTETSGEIPIGGML
jgi:hypothetical protein